MMSVLPEFGVNRAKGVCGPVPSSLLSALARLELNRVCGVEPTCRGTHAQSSNLHRHLKPAGWLRNRRKTGRGQVSMRCVPNRKPCFIHIHIHVAIKSEAA